jgi:hypothetical protein
VKCPFCGKGVKDGAALCRACGNILDPALGASSKKNKRSGFTQIVELDAHEKTATDVEVSVDINSLREQAKLVDPNDPTVIKAKPADPTVLKRATPPQQLPQQPQKRTSTGELLLAIEAEMAATKGRIELFNDPSVTDLEIAVNLEAVRAPSTAEKTLVMERAPSQPPAEEDPATLAIAPLGNGDPATLAIAPLGNNGDPSTIPLTIRPPGSTTAPQASPAPELDSDDL